MLSADMLFFCVFFFYCYGDHRDLHSFPTRRSSDLILARLSTSRSRAPRRRRGSPRRSWRAASPTTARTPTSPPARSEEHTSELQSLRHLVCRLLLEKKKKKTER